MPENCPTYSRRRRRLRPRVPRLSIESRPRIHGRSRCQLRTRENRNDIIHGVSIISRTALQTHARALFTVRFQFPFRSRRHQRPTEHRVEKLDFARRRTRRSESLPSARGPRPQQQSLILYLQVTAAVQAGSRPPEAPQVDHRKVRERLDNIIMMYSVYIGLADC